MKMLAMGTLHVRLNVNYLDILIQKGKRERAYIMTDKTADVLLSSAICFVSGVPV